MSKVPGNCFCGSDIMVKYRILLTASDLAGDGTLIPKKNDLKPWQKQEWCIPEVSGDYGAAMEDVLDVYEEPYDPPHPVVCFDETPRQLIGAVREPQPMQPGQPVREDTE